MSAVILMNERRSDPSTDHHLNADNEAPELPLLVGDQRQQIPWAPSGTQLPAEYGSHLAGVHLLYHRQLQQQYLSGSSSASTAVLNGSKTAANNSVPNVYQVPDIVQNGLSSRMFLPVDNDISAPRMHSVNLMASHLQDFQSDGFTAALGHVGLYSRHMPRTNLLGQNLMNLLGHTHLEYPTVQYNLPEALVSSAHNDSVLTAPLSENSDSNDSLSSQPTEQPTASATVMPIFSGIVNSEGNSFYCLGEDFQNIEHVRIYCEENCVSPAPTYRSTMVVLNAAASAEETRRINHAIHMVNDGFLLYGMKHVLEFKKMMEEKYIVSDCLLGQPQITPTLRGNLISWMLKLQQRLNMGRETLFLAVNCVDRFLATTKISQDCFQLLGIAALWVTAKLEEIYHPTIDTLLRVADNPYNRDQLKQMEIILLTKLQFSLNSTTSLFYLEYYATYRLSTAKITGCTLQQIRQTRALALYLLELVIQNYGLSQHAPSLLALCCLEIADLYFGQCTRPDPLYAENHTVDTLKECLGEVDKILDVNLQPCSDVPGRLAPYLEWFEKSGGDKLERPCGVENRDAFMGNDEDAFSDGEDQWVVMDRMFKKRKLLPRVS